MNDVKALEIREETFCPSSNWFNAHDCQPDLTEDGTVLLLYSGKAHNGKNGVDSTIVLQSEALVSTFTGFYHKHGGGQYWRHYVPQASGVGWQQVRWAALNDDQRQLVLDAFQTKAPYFARVPGKLRTERKAPTPHVQTAYKIVAIGDDGALHSLYKPEVTYEIGTRLAEKAASGHGGGYYSYPNAAGVKRRFLSGELVHSSCVSQGMRVALIEVEIGGTIVEYTDGDGWLSKVASTYLRPVRILETFVYGLEEVVA